MSIHVEEQLDLVTTTLTQKFQLVKDATLLHVAPKLLINNDPAGTFTMTIKRGAAVVASKALTVVQMNAAILAQLGTVELYKLGYFLFTFTNPINLRRDVEYDLVLTTAGYTFTNASSMGWIKGYENETNDLNDVADTDLGKALSYRLWGYQNA